MAAASRHEGSLHITGTLTANAATLPDSCITDDMIADGAEIAASKVIHQHAVSRELFPYGYEVVDAEELLTIIYGATGSIVAFRAAVEDPCTDDNVFTLDLQKSTSAGAFASVLVSPLSFTVSDAARTVKSATINTSALVAGDVLKVVVNATTPSPTTGNASGLLVTLTHTETPS